MFQPSPTARRDRAGPAYVPAMALAFAGVVSLVLQWHSARPLWVDEEMIALNVRDRPFSGLAGALWMNQSAPLGWLGLERLILVEWGTAERTLRALPVLFGIATVLLAAWAGYRWMGWLAAALFVLLCSFGPVISYFPLEIKQYSVDSCCGVLFPALTAWAIERDGNGRQSPAISADVWWLAAIVGVWFSVTVLFLAPGCALLLCAAAWRRGGWPRAFRTAAPGVLLLASFAFVYYFSLRYTLASTYLRTYWREAYPPQAAGLTGTLDWLLTRLVQVADNPGGSRWPALFWLATAAGMTLAIRRHVWFGLAMLSVPIFALLFSVLGFVPLGDRLSLWVVPSLYAALAIACGDALVLAWSYVAGREWAGALAAGIVTLMAAVVIGDVATTGVYYLALRPSSKHNLDDRAAVRYLMQLRAPGDVIITSRLGLPAVWWYGGISVSAPNLGQRTADGARILRMGFRSGDECRPGEVPPVLEGHRALIYMGFDSNSPPGLRELALDTLAKRGRIIAFRAIAEEGIVAAFDLNGVPVPWPPVAAGWAGPLRPEIPRPAGCLGFFQEPRW